MSHPALSRLGNWGWGLGARRDNQDYSWWVFILTAWSVQQPQLHLLVMAEEIWGRAVKDRQHSSFSCVFSVHLKDLTALFLPCLCLIFLHTQVFRSTFSFGEPLRRSVGLGVNSFLPSTSRMGLQITLLGHEVWWAIRIPLSSCPPCYNIVKPGQYCQVWSQTSDVLCIWLVLEGCAILCTFFWWLLGLVK